MAALGNLSAGSTAEWWVVHKTRSRTRGVGSGNKSGGEKCSEEKEEAARGTEYLFIPSRLRDQGKVLKPALEAC